MYEEIEYLRQRIDELERRMTVVGDDITTAVDHTPGGQIVRALYEVSEEVEEVAEESYISVTYDSVAEEFTVNFGAFPFYEINEYLASNGGLVDNVAYKNSGESSISGIDYKFDKPISGNQFIYFYLFRNMSDSPSSIGKPSLGWVSTATTTDSDTAKLEKSAAPSQFNIGTVKIYDDGTYEIILDFKTDKAPAVFGRVRSLPELYVSTAGRTINLTRVIDRIDGNNWTDSISYTEPITDSIIIGYTESTETMALDFRSNSGSYDEFQIVGYVEIDSNNYIKRFLQYDRNAMTMVTPFGYTGSIGPSDSFIVRNGIITKKL